MLPEGGVPKSLGLIQDSGVSRVALPAPPDVSLANVPALAVSLEPSGGSHDGCPDGPCALHRQGRTILLICRSVVLRAPL